MAELHIIAAAFRKAAPYALAGLDREIELAQKRVDSAKANLECLSLSSSTPRIAAAARRVAKAGVELDRLKRLRAEIKEARRAF